MNLEEFLNIYPPEVKDLLSTGRNFLINNVSELQEEIDLPSRILVYRIADGMKGIVFSLIPSKQGVKLGFYRGREMDDPARLMEGRGKVHSTIPLNAELFSNYDLHALVNQAVAKARTRLNPER